MRTISAASLAKLNQKLGTEPANIVEIDWGNGLSVSYADQDIDSIPGRILELGEMDPVVDIFNSNTSQTASLRLDDTDSTVKAIFNTQEIHEVPIRIYQWFQGLDVDEKFLVFAGQISSPITWREADRSFSFSATSEVEDKEFGFSAEEGQFPFLPSELVGKPWPSIFGKEIDVPALQVNKAVSGTTLCPVGILSGKGLHLAAPLGGDDCGLGMSVLMASQQISFLNVASAAWSGTDSQRSGELADQANQLRVQLAGAVGQRNQQVLCAQSKRAQTLSDAENQGEGCNPVRVLGGEDFPQNTPITVNINGGLFTGTMSNDSFSISSRQHPENTTKSESRSDFVEASVCQTPTPAQFFDFSMEVPPGTGDFSTPNRVRRNGFIICTLPTTSRPTATSILQHFWADSGSRVTIAGNEPITFIVSITPGEVLAVKAYKNFNGEKRLVNVPNSIFSVETVDYGSVTAVQVTTNKPLSTIEGQGWEDQIYVTFESTIGPNPVDILEYVVENYTDLTADAASFAAVKTSLDNGGGVLGNNMAILDRKNTVELLRELAFLNRCAIWVNNGIVHLKYLPVEPVSDQTITTSDFRFGSVEVSTGSTEDLTTKLVAEWRYSEAEEEPQEIPVRNNVDKYGTKEEVIYWFTHNQADIIYKIVTFWLIRTSNSWKTISFDGFLHLLQLETFDTVTLNLPDYVASGPVKAMVLEARYDSASQSVKVKCLVPVRTGEMTEYPLFWPADKINITYPVPGDEDHAGGSGIGEDATGSLPVGRIEEVVEGGTIFIGGPNVVFGPQSDRGDKNPWDTGFTPSDILLDGVFADVDAQDNPNPDLDLNYIGPMPAMELPDIPGFSTSIIDIRKTPIIDSDNDDVEATLDSIIRSIGDDKLRIDTESLVDDGENVGPFDFKWDEEDSEFGAGTGFLE